MTHRHLIDFSLIREGLLTSDFADAPRRVVDVEHAVVHHQLTNVHHDLPRPSQQEYINASFSQFSTEEVMEWALWCDENTYQHIGMSGVA
jgi:hypothetical protein